MVDLIQKKNGQYVKLISCRKEQGKSFYDIQDEFGFKTLDSYQIIGEPITSDRFTIDTFIIHPILKKNLIAEMGLKVKVEIRKDDLLGQLIKRGISYVDHRKKGGCLWVQDNDGFRSQLIFFKNSGFRFQYCLSSKALGHKAGWFIV
jgi:hypothetical protein